GSSPLAPCRTQAKKYLCGLSLCPATS
ncbi:uncharacterized protein WCI35_027188, partial [Daubentonia madagascariensis]